MLTKDDFNDIFHANTVSVLIDGKRQIVLMDSAFAMVIEKLIQRAEYNREQNEPQEVSSVRCDLCSHEWVAVRPAVGLTQLECPNCGNMVNFENV